MSYLPVLLIPSEKSFTVSKTFVVGTVPLKRVFKTSKDLR